MILVSFYLGPAVDLSARTVKSYNLATVPPTLLETLTPGASAESCEFNLPDNARIRIELTDTTANGVDLLPAILDFVTTEPNITQTLISGGNLLRPVSYDEESSSSQSTLSSSSSTLVSTQSSSSSSRSSVSSLSTVTMSASSQSSLSASSVSSSSSSVTNSASSSSSSSSSSKSSASSSTPSASSQSS